MKQTHIETKAVITKVDNATYKVLKIGSTTNLSGKHKLTYHIGCNDRKDICFRIYENSGGGYFSAEWVLLDAVKEAIEISPSPITSSCLYSLFKGRSVNTPAFLLATLLNEGLITPNPDNIRAYQLSDLEAFLKEIRKLIDANIEVKVIPSKT